MHFQAPAEKAKATTSMGTLPVLQPERSVKNLIGARLWNTWTLPFPVKRATWRSFRIGTEPSYGPHIPLKILLRKRATASSSYVEIQSFFSRGLLGWSLRSVHPLLRAQFLIVSYGKLLVSPLAFSSRASCAIFDAGNWKLFHSVTLPLLSVDSEPSQVESPFLILYRVRPKACWTWNSRMDRVSNVYSIIRFRRLHRPRICANVCWFIIPMFHMLLHQ